MNTDWQQFGQHSLRREGDILHWRWIGELTAPDIDVLIAAIGSVLEDHEWVYFIVDARLAGGSHRGARAQFIDHPYRLRISAVAYIGAGFAVRVLIGTFTNALKLLGRPQAAVGFVSNEEEALDYIDGQRREVIAQEPGKGA